MRGTLRVPASAGVLLLTLIAGCGPTAPGPRGAPTGELTIFAAASLQGVLDELAADFAERHPGVTVAPIVYDGSPTLVTQLLEGASADVLATADERTMATVVESGLVAGEPALFATNTLRIAVTGDNPLGVTGLADLAALLSDGGRVAVCAPEVPCGAATASAVAAAGVTLAGASEEQSVAAVLTKIAQGEVDAGVVYATDVTRTGLTGIDAPELAGVVTTYPVAVLAAARAPEEARAFVDFLGSEQARAVLIAHGFGQP